MTDAVIYCRISKDPEGRQVGVDRQEKDCRDVAARIGLKVTRVYVDNDISASTLSQKRRPAYEEMMTLAESGQVRVILAYSNSRLTRRPLELERLINAHDRTGVEFHTVVSGQDDLSKADGRMVARIKASVDAAESERIGERVRAAKAHARQNGQWLGGWRRYGFQVDGVTVRDDEAAVLAEMSDAVLSGDSLTSLVRKLNAAEVPTSTGKQWTTRSLKRVLTRSHPSVDAGVTEAVRVLLEDESRRTSPGPERRWLLSGLAHCDVCKGVLRGSGSSLGAGRGTYPAYRCRSGKHIVVNAIVLDDFISALVVERLRRADLRDVLTPKTPDASKLYVEAATLRGRLDALADDIQLDERTLQRRVKALQVRLDEVQQQIADAARTGPLAPFHGRDPQTVWDELDLTRRRAVVALLMTITVQRSPRGVVPVENRWREDLPAFDPRRVVIEWRK